jgi:hypothetical protein
MRLRRFEGAVLQAPICKSELKIDSLLCRTAGPDSRMEWMLRDSLVTKAQEAGLGQV